MRFHLYSLVLLLVLPGRWVKAQPLALNFRQFTTADGVPSSETYFTYEDTEGFLWVGTDNGIARFNGYEFEVFDDETGLEDAVVFSLQETPDGRIWVSTLSGQVYFFEHGRFHSYPYNEQLLKIKQSSELIYIIDVLSTGELIMKVEYQGIVRIETNGGVTWLTDNNKSRLYIYRPERRTDGYPRQYRYYISATSRRPSTYVSEVMDWNGKAFVPLPVNASELPLMVPKRSMVTDRRAEGEGIFIFSLYGLVHIGPDHRVTVIDFRNYGPEHLMPFSDGRFIVSSRGGEGFSIIRPDLEAGTIDAKKFLTGRSVAMTRLDSRGGLWVNSLDAGVFYCPNPEQILHVAEDDALGSRPVAITFIDSSLMVACYSSGNLLIHDLYSGKQQKINPGGGRGFLSDDLYFDKVSRNLFWLNYVVHIPENLNLEKSVVRRLTVDEKITPHAVKEFRVEGDTLFWTGTQSFGSIDQARGHTVTRLPYYPNNKATHGLESYYRFPNGKEYVGTWYGMRRVADGTRLEPDNLGIPELSGRISRILPFGGDTVAIGTRSAGLVLWWPGAHEVITTEGGLASNSVRNMHLDEKGVLWVATFDGLSKITRNAGGEGVVIRTYNQGNGLVDNEIHDVESDNGRIFLASTSGIYNFIEPARDSLSAPPNLTEVSVNGKEAQLREHLALEPGENYLSFSYSTILFSMRGGVLYRYRINPDQPWQETRERLANYPNLPAGEYRFEVQSQNQDGVWSESTVQSVEIRQYWFYTWKARLLAVALIVGGLSLYFYYREQRRRREQDLLLEISRLEHSALHAQMNPHFVFNCLNSIQNFILHNETHQAAKYLARFAHLIRQTLYSSVEGVHSLGDELDMLGRYLELEKLRFKDVFDYEVTADDQLDKDGIFLAPLLVQPFVENAVLHGFSERSSGGLIQVHFSGQADLIKVTVTDNGVGINPEAEVKKGSMGMGITRRRLDLLKGKKHPGLTLEVKPVTGPGNDVQGTRVTLLIQPAETPLPALSTDEF